MKQAAWLGLTCVHASFANTTTTTTTSNKLLQLVFAAVASTIRLVVTEMHSLRVGCTDNNGEGNKQTNHNGGG